MTDEFDTIHKYFMISKGDVIHIAKLARLELTEQEIEKMQKDLSSILDYFDVLKKAESKKITLAASQAKNVLRQDDVQTKASPEDLIKAAPEKKDGYIKVKAVL